MKIIKANTYNIVSNEPFEIPLPLRFELWCDNALLVAYSISEDAKVDFSFNPDANEKILTSTSRPLVMPDIYFLFSSRVFPDKQYYTRFELNRFGIKEYNPYEIARKTHGILPNDRYWLKFEGETYTHGEALDDYNSYYYPKRQNTVGGQEELMKPAETVAVSESERGEVNRILEQHSFDFDRLSAEIIPENTQNRAAEADSFISAVTAAENSASNDDVFEPFLPEAADSSANVITSSAPAAETDSGSSEKLSDDQIAALFAKLNGG